MESKKPKAKICCKQGGYSKKIVSAVIVTVLVFVGLMSALISNFFAFGGSVEYKIEENEAIKVIIPSGATTGIIGNILKDDNIIKFPLMFKVTSRLKGYDGLYKSGVHKLSKKMTYEQMMIALTKNPEVVTLTIPEGFNIKQVAELFEHKNIASKSQFEKALQNSFHQEFFKNIPIRENRLEGYFFPDTYYFGILDSKESMINAVMDNFQKKYTAQMDKRAKELNSTMDQIIIMASIVEREAKLSEERKKIAGVFYNRLKSSNPYISKLQSCATIQYILYMNYGAIKEKLTDADLKIQSKYNTYMYKGLPPGPICSPGIDAINAALYPDKHDYLYFVSKGDGSHAFSKTLAEHNAAIAKYGHN